MTEYKFPTPDEVMGFGSAHNAAVWAKHRQHLSDPSGLDAVLRACQSPSQKLSRRQVFEIADANPEWGVIAAVVWGFPRGSMPGGKWLSFANAFESSLRFAEVLAEFRANTTSATTAIARLNNLVGGLGFATTTKMAYFARLVFQEGPSLIFDANVIKAIVDPSGPWETFFPRTKSMLGSTNLHAKGVLSYSSYVEESAALAKLHNTTPDVIEVALFRFVARAGSWS
jgi:hypothetical protein